MSVEMTNPLLRRAFIFLEDGNWQMADTYCERVLDMEPENAEAYLAKLMVKLEVNTRELLASCAKTFENEDNYRKVMRYGDQELQFELQGYIDQILERNENARIEGLYQEACNRMRGATLECQYVTAAAAFDKVPGYKDADEKKEQCINLAESAKKDAILTNAKQVMECGDDDSCHRAFQLLESIADWRNARELIDECRKILNKNERRRREEIERLRKKKIWKTVLILIAVIAVLIIFFVCFHIVPERKYDSAIELREEGKYSEAISVFAELKDYKDSETQILETYYTEGLAKHAIGDWTGAIAAYQNAGNYKDSASKINECRCAISDEKYIDAIALLEAEEYSKAYDAFQEIRGHKDSDEKAANIERLALTDRIENAQIGDCIIFGHYEQDNDNNNGKEDIEWIVLARSENRIMVVSKKALDCIQYYSSYSDVTWETSSLRLWLNTDFYNTAFSSNEKMMIPIVTVEADESTNYGNSTSDRVFILSEQECQTILRNANGHKYEITEYADAKKPYTRDIYCWTRTPAYYTNSDNNRNDIVHTLRDDGTLYFLPGVNDTNIFVRPVLWLDLDADVDHSLSALVLPTPTPAPTPTSTPKATTQKSTTRYMECELCGEKTNCTYTTSLGFSFWVCSSCRSWMLGD